MDDEPVEELRAGSTEQRRGGSRWWLLPLVAALGLAWWLLPDQPPAPRPAPTPSVSPSPTGGYQPGFHDARPTLETVCEPVTDGRHRLTVRFVLINRNTDRLSITDVRPTLPLGGLQLLRTTLVRGGCGAPLDEPLLIPLESGSEALVVFTFALPRDCPQPLPVGVQVTTQVPDVPRSQTTTEIAVYPDLGSVDFDTCP